MKKILFILLAILCVQAGSAQKFGFAASYPLAFSSGNLNDYISKTGFRGLSIEVNRKQTANIQIGIEGSWNAFYEKKDRDVYTEGTASISGVQFRYTNAVPILAQARYFHGINSGKSVVPFAGLGIGTLYIDRFTDFGLYRITTDTWQFCLRPELGIAFRSRNAPAGFLSCRYYGGFNSDELSGQSYFTINIGVMFSGL